LRASADQPMSFHFVEETWLSTIYPCPASPWTYIPSEMKLYVAFQNQQTCEYFCPKSPSSALVAFPHLHDHSRPLVSLPTSSPILIELLRQTIQVSISLVIFWARLGHQSETGFHSLLNRLFFW
jgi:hypothetical protein